MFLLFRRKTAYELRISDWSSDVCSSSVLEYLASARTQAVLNSLTAPHPGRIVIFDSPPVLAASPASALASHVGQAVLVVRADKTTENALRDAVGLLHACDHIQLLLNGVQFSTEGRHFGTYYGEIGRASCRERVCQYV